MAKTLLLNEGEKMAKKKLFVVVLGFAVTAIVAANTNRQIFNSWVGSHYTELSGKIPGRASYTENSITYDSSWTKDVRVWKGRAYNTNTGEGVGDYGMVSTGRKITYERWVTFYFDKNGIITTWRSYGWKMD
jgi:photosystem II stability/assembly factor-like uncharacterized protein